MGTSTNSSEHTRFLSPLLYLAVGLIIISVLAFNIFQPIKVLPRVTLSPGFTLINQNGETRTSEDYRGKYTIYSFMYTNCGEECTEIINSMSSLQDEISMLDYEELDFALVSISLDPERDSPDVLNVYVADVLGGKESPIPWDFLTGDTLRTKYVVGGGFSLYYQSQYDNSQDEGDYRVNFDPRYVIVDGWGIIRAEYITADLDTEKVLSDIEYLAKENQNSKGAAKLAYEAAHLFRCYP